jgi:hypothetical protein
MSPGGDCRNDEAHDAGVAAVRPHDVNGMDDQRSALAANFGELVDSRQDFAPARRRDRRVLDEAILHVDVEERCPVRVELEIGHDAAPRCQA